MARIVWTDPALEDLSKIIDYIALDKPSAAKNYAKTVFEKVERLESYPKSGRKLPELKETMYLEIIVNPSRIIYRKEGDDVVILHVCRGEMAIDADLISKR